jgi:hypothetical protein
MKRKYIADKNHGIKFALAVYYNKLNDEKFSKDLCKFYISINDKFHPSIKPINCTIQTIKELEKIIGDNETVSIELGTSRSVINELIEKLIINEYIYK